MNNLKTNFTGRRTPSVRAKRSLPKGISKYGMQELKKFKHDEDLRIKEMIKDGSIDEKKFIGNNLHFLNEEAKNKIFQFDIKYMKHRNLMAGLMTGFCQAAPGLIAGLCGNIPLAIGLGVTTAYTVYAYATSKRPRSFLGT